jgi:ketosteroid isomerase-like protein
MYGHVRYFGQDLDAWAGLFAEEASLEFPYLSSVGFPTRTMGRDSIRAHVGTFLSAMEGYYLTDVRVYGALEPGRVFAEYNVDATVKATGQSYCQRFFTVLLARGGKIVLLREYLDTVVVAKALLPNGLHDLIDPAGDYVCSVDSCEAVKRSPERA